MPVVLVVGLVVFTFLYVLGVALIAWLWWLAGHPGPDVGEATRGQGVSPESAELRRAPPLWSGRPRVSPWAYPSHAEQGALDERIATLAAREKATSPTLARPETELQGEASATRSSLMT